MPPKCGLWTSYIAASVGHLRTSHKILSQDWWILHESTNSSVPNNSISWGSFQMQLVNVTIFILSFFLVKTGMYKGHGWLQAMQSPSSYTSTTYGEISPSQQYKAECCHTQKGPCQFVNAFKNIQMQSIWSHNVPAAKQHVSAALTHGKVPDIRKQPLKVECCSLEHGYSVTCSFSIEK